MSALPYPDVTIDRSGPGQQVLAIKQRFGHDADRLWHALTDGGELSKWFPCTVRLELRAGGTIEFLFPGEEPDSGEVLEVEPGRRLAFTWDEEVLRWAVERSREAAGSPGSGSLLSLSNSLQDPAMAAQVAAGWHQCFEDLGAVLDGKPRGTEGAQSIDELVAHYRRLLG